MTKYLVKVCLANKQARSFRVHTSVFFGITKIVLHEIQFTILVATLPVSLH